MHIKKVHISSMTILNDSDENIGERLSFGIMARDNDREKFDFISMNRDLMIGKPNKPSGDDNFYLILVDTSKKNEDGFYQGQAFQNGKILKHYSKTFNNILQHHYFIGYIGKYYDKIMAKPLNSLK